MNVLLAEADVEYDAMREMDDINGEFGRTNVAIVIGANDVTNPAARNDPRSRDPGSPRFVGPAGGLLSAGPT